MKLNHRKSSKVTHLIEVLTRRSQDVLCNGRVSASSIALLAKTIVKLYNPVKKTVIQPGGESVA